MATKANAAPPLTESISALVLDDSAFDRRRICRLGAASKLPIRFEEASTLEAMKASIDHENFDVMLIDYRLNDGNGFSALELLKQSDRHRDAVKIMISGSEKLDVAVNALKLGCDDYLSKQDMSVDRLKQAILQAMQRRRSAEHSIDLRAEMQRTMLEVLHSPELKRALQPVLIASMRKASQAIAIERRLSASPSLQSFMRHFQEDDDFSFQAPPATSTG